MSETVTQYQPANLDILNLAAASLSAAHDLSDDERTTRFQTVVHGTMALLPADLGQTMLGTLILGHLLNIMDGFRDIGRLTLTPAQAARARMVTVAQTKLVLQLLREMRIACTEARNQTRPEVAKPAQRPAGDAGCEAAPLAKFMTAYDEALAALAATDTVRPAVAGKAWEAPRQAAPPKLFAAPREEKDPTPVLGSRAQRRAMMKRNGAFKRTT
jgi:hypothetical protein